MESYRISHSASCQPSLEITSLPYRDYSGTCLCHTQQNIVVHSKWLWLL